MNETLIFDYLFNYIVKSKKHGSLLTSVRHPTINLVKLKLKNNPKKIDDNFMLILYLKLE
jgi:hypothetical protein